MVVLHSPEGMEVSDDCSTGPRHTRYSLQEDQPIHPLGRGQLPEHEAGEEVEVEAHGLDGVESQAITQARRGCVLHGHTLHLEVRPQWVGQVVVVGIPHNKGVSQPFPVNFLLQILRYGFVCVVLCCEATPPPLPGHTIHQRRRRRRWEGCARSERQEARERACEKHGGRGKDVGDGERES